MMVPARISIVTLGVSDLSRAAAFYEALGWERTKSSNQAICWFRTAGTYLGLFPYEELAKDANLPATPRARFGGVTLAMNVESEKTVADVLQTAEAAGAKIIKNAQHADWGGYSGYFADVDGHPWEVAFNPHFPITPDGSIRIP